MDVIEDSKHVVICGGGIIGAASAYYLALKGIQCTIIERYKVAGCASGKAGGFLAGGWGSEDTQELHQVGFALHEEIAKTLNIQSYRKLETFSVSGNAGRGKKGKFSSNIPWLDGAVRKCVIMDKDTAQVSPDELTNRLVEEACKLGCKVIIGKVEGMTMTDDNTVTHVELEDSDPIACDQVLIALGPWSVLAEQWFDGLKVPMVGIWSSSLVFKHDPKDVFGAAIFCSEDENGCHIEVYPRPDGQVYVCGCGGSRHIQPKRLRTLNPEEVVADPARVAAATKSFSNMSSLANNSPDIQQACMRPCMSDSLPSIGAISGTKNAYICAGHNCWGILWSLVSGRTMSELMTGSKTQIDISPFDPGRF